MNDKLKKELEPYIIAYQNIQRPKKKTVTADSELRVPIELTPQQQQAIQNAKDAWTTFAESPAGIAFLAKVAAMDINQIVAALVSLAEENDGPVYQAVSALKEEAEDMGLAYSSFSIGLSFEIEIILGFTITIGVAIGVDVSDGITYSEFLSVGLTEGVDEGGELGVKFGLWKNLPSDLGGFTVDTEAEIGLLADLGGVAVYQLEDEAELLGLSVELAVGEEDGIDEGENYTFILGSQGGSSPDQNFDWFHQSYQPLKSHFVMLDTLTCINQKQVGNDEIFFTFVIDSIDNSSGNVTNADAKTYYFPPYDYYSMDDDHGSGDDGVNQWTNWDCGRSVWFDDNVIITLYDDNSGNQSLKNPLGSVTIKSSDLPTKNNPLNISNDSDVSYNLTAFMLN